MTAAAVQQRNSPAGRNLPRPQRSRASKPKFKPIAFNQNWRLRSRHCFLLIIVLVAQGIFFASSLFQVQSIHVAGLETLRQKQVLDLAGLKNGDFLWGTSPTTVANNVAQLQNVERAHVEYSLPGKVSITVYERQPVYQVATVAATPTWYSVDAYGLVLRKLKGTSNTLPRLKLEQPIKVGQRLHPALMATCSRACSEVEEQFPAAVWYYTLDERGNLSFRTFSRQYPVDVQLGPVDNLSHKLNILRTLMQTVMLKERVTSVDLRYSAPVVRLLHPPKPKEATEPQA